jgi:ATP-binding protein involved in chromosome partitioning
VLASDEEGGSLDALRFSLASDIVELEMVRSIDSADGLVRVTVSLTTPGCPIRSHFETAVQQAVGALAGVQRVQVSFDVLSDTEKAGLQQKLGRPGGLPEGALAQVSNVVCIGSGKGGVGKSTITANLAAALTADGKRVGVLDADVWGYSIPRMFGVSGRPPVSPQRKIMPLEGHGVKVMSIGFFVEEDSAVVWRGPMLHKALQQFLEDVAWGELDYLLIDLPPGTGEPQQSLVQQIALDGAVIVTTPQDLSLLDASRSLGLFRQASVRLLGMIENMSYLICPHCGERIDVFHHSERRWDIQNGELPLLGQIPMDAAISKGIDAGHPLVQAAPDSTDAQAFREIAAKLVERLGAA